MRLQRVRSIGKYADFLRSHSEEVDRLFKDLLIGVTSFFRDSPAFNELVRKVLVGLVHRRHPDSPIRVWIPGCSTGEEVYSIAIVLAEQLALAKSASRMRIFATDIDEEALQIARAGSYPESIARAVTPQRRRRFFVHEGGRYKITPPIRESIIFAVQNLISDPPFSKLDLISCRNVLIYLEPEMREKLLSLFHYALRPGGCLFLGSEEDVRPREELFAPVSKGQGIFRRAGAIRPALDQVPMLTPAESPPRPGPKRATGLSIDVVTDQQLLQHLAPPAVVVRSGGQIVRFFGGLEPYMTLPTGAPTLDVLTLVRDALRPTLRAALHEAVRRHCEIALEAPHVKRGRRPSKLRITVKPINAPKSVDPLWLVVFEQSWSTMLPAGAVSSTPRRKPDLVSRLETELGAAKREQQHLADQIQRRNQQLWAANEEVLSMNEELQSTNEQLTTSKEELQSMNEELTTLNTHLQDKVNELTATNDDLANLLMSTDIATVFLDTALSIKRFTTAASHVLNLQPVDLGRPLHHIATNLENVDLSFEARAVLESLAPMEKEVVSRDRRQYLLRCLPYRTRDSQVHGVVLTLVDITTLKHAERELTSARVQVADELRRMTRLHDLGERLAGSGDKAALGQILGAATEITGADKAHIQECDDAGVLTIAAQVGFEQPFLDYFACVESPSDAACGHAISNHQRVMIADVTSSPILEHSPSRSVLLAAGVRAVQSTPLLDRSARFVGMFSTLYRTPHCFDETEQRWLDLLARHAADAIERHRANQVLLRSREDLERRVVERTQWLTLLHEISRSINDAPTWDTALQRVLQKLCSMEEWQLGYVYLPDPAAPDVIAPTISCVGEKRFQSFHELSERQRYRRGERLPGQVYASRAPQFLNDRKELLEAIPIRARAAEQAGLRAGVALPIVVGQEVIAVLEVFSDRAHPRNDWFDNLMPAIGDQIGRILERERTTARMADLVWREQQDLLHTLHDALGQTLTGLGMLSSGLGQRLTGVDKQAADTASEIAKQAQHALEQVRQLSRSLFPVEVESETLTAALRELASATESLHKVRTRLQGHVPQGFSDGNAATQLYRIAQEAVTNAVRHAKASTITLQIDGSARMLRLQIIDDGVGIGNAASGNGIGMQIMRYRAHSIGGVLTIEPGSARGTVVTCMLRATPGPGKSIPKQVELA